MSGFRTFLPNGELISDSRFRWGRFLGNQFVPKPTGNAHGTISHPGLSSGEVFWRVSGTTSNYIMTPNIYMDGGLLHWDYNFDQIGGTAVYSATMLSDIYILYGVR